MIIVDNAIKNRLERKEPIRVGILGSGAMAKGLIQHINSHRFGISVVCTYGRNLQKLKSLYESIGINNYQIADSEKQNKSDQTFR